MSAACASSTVAIAEGAAMIRAGEAESVLFVACDFVSEFVAAGFAPSARSRLIAHGRSIATERPQPRRGCGLPPPDGRAPRGPKRGRLFDHLPDRLPPCPDRHEGCRVGPAASARIRRRAAATLRPPGVRRAGS
ncbi:MAG: hypothetical protein FJ207_15070, partial [Gemmatimonadetes bacterium]|nr:hypothetical protein [Gemmatimonadota bacterium]